MEDKVLELILEEDLIRPGEKILAAVSGGPDSVCLLHVLVRLCATLGCSLGVVHINHRLRGPQSDEEEEFVRSLAKGLLLPGFFCREDVAELAKDRRQGIEETARQVRYDFFERVMQTEGFDKTALAHNLNDQAETILHRLIRGSGLNGLAGMRPSRGGQFIRPLLYTARPQIEAYLEEHALNYRLDPSNDSLDYTRNRIRHSLIPSLEEFNPEVVRSLGGLSRTLDWDRDYLEQAAKDLAGRFIRQEKDKVLIEQPAFARPKAMISRLLFEALERLTGSRLDLTMVQVQDILKLQAGETGKRLNLKGGVTVYNHYGQLEWTKDNGGADLGDGPVRVDLLALPVEAKFNSWRIRFSSEPPDGPSWPMDASRHKALVIRSRQEHDRIKLLGMDGYKKVKKIFIDRKIHRGIRAYLPLITDETGEVLFIYPGICSEAFRITQNTAKIVYITVTENNNGK